jgi:hypothetical protein
MPSPVSILVCGDTKAESREAFQALHRHLIPGSALCMGSDVLIGSLDPCTVPADLSATIYMYAKDDLKAIPELLCESR